MKHIYRILIVFAIGVVGFSVLHYSISSTNITLNNNLYNTYNGVTVDTPKETDTVKEANIDQTVVKEEVKETVPVDTNKNTTETVTKTNVIETLTGTMSGYGHDCYGCTSGKTASGYDISDGNIYYSDTNYGNVRILSADSKYPFGTIIKISNFDNMDSFYAIVLDRGGSIGLNKRINFDLLYSNNSEALDIGIEKNITFEIERLGY